MPNMSLKKNPMPSLEPAVRRRNFDEVALGYTEEQAVDEAARCLNCKHHPCMSGCPVQIDIPAFIARVRERDFEGAYAVLTRQSSLPAVCGRVCPQENQCEGKCVRGIKGEPVAVGRLERFVADWHAAHAQDAPAKPVSNGRRVAVVGSGPAGLACAGDLVKKRLRRDGVRGAPHPRRGAGLRHSGVPAAQGHRSAGNRLPAPARSQGGDQHGHR